VEKTFAYIAGIFDGEGCLMVGKYPNKGNKNLGYRSFMSLANTNIPLLVYVKGIIGGKIVKQSIKGRYAGSFCYTLTLSSNEVRKCLPNLINYLIVKKEQAEVLLSFLERQANNASAPVSDELLNFYESCYQKLKDLKKIRYEFKEEIKSLGVFDCAQCGEKFERTSKNPRKIYCSLKCKKIVHYTRSNNRIRLGIPAWAGA